MYLMRIIFVSAFLRYVCCSNSHVICFFNGSKPFNAVFWDYPARGGFLRAFAWNLINAAFIAWHEIKTGLKANLSAMQALYENLQSLDSK